MENSQATAPVNTDYLYQYAANLLVNGKKSTAAVEHLLALKGVEAESAATMVRELQAHIQEARKAKAKKDMLHGGLWCAGGLALTLADIGFIFWGAIVFGGVQFIKGVINLK